MTPETIFFQTTNALVMTALFLAMSPRGWYRTLWLIHTAVLFFLQVGKKNRGGALYPLKADWTLWIHFAYLGQCSFLPRNMQPSQSALFQREIICSPLAQYVGDHLQCLYFYLHSPVFRDHLHKTTFSAFQHYTLRLVFAQTEHPLQKKKDEIASLCLVLKVSIFSPFNTK